MAMTRVMVQLPSDLLEEVDRLRGDVPRAAYIRRAVERVILGAQPLTNVRPQVHQTASREVTPRFKR